MSSQVVTAAVIAMEEHHEKFNHWFAGLIAIGILLFLLLALIGFGGGREHS